MTVHIEQLSLPINVPPSNYQLIYSKNKYSHSYIVKRKSLTSIFFCIKHLKLIFAYDSIIVLEWGTAFFKTFSQAFVKVSEKLYVLPNHFTSCLPFLPSSWGYHVSSEVYSYISNHFYCNLIIRALYMPSKHPEELGSMHSFCIEKEVSPVLPQGI